MYDEIIARIITAIETNPLLKEILTDTDELSFIARSAYNLTSLDNNEVIINGDPVTNEQLVVLATINMSLFTYFMNAREPEHINTLAVYVESLLTTYVDILEYEYNAGKYEWWEAANDYQLTNYDTAVDFFDD